MTRNKILIYLLRLLVTLLLLHFKFYLSQNLNLSMQDKSKGFNSPTWLVSNFDNLSIFSARTGSHKTTPTNSHVCVIKYWTIIIWYLQLLLLVRPSTTGSGRQKTIKSLFFSLIWTAVSQRHHAARIIFIFSPLPPFPSLFTSKSSL